MEHPLLLPHDSCPLLVVITNPKNDIVSDFYASTLSNHLNVKNEKGYAGIREFQCLAPPLSLS